MSDVPEAPLEPTAEGLVPAGEGWFVLNARDARWYHAEGRAAVSDLEGETEFTQLGIHVVVLGPGQPMAMYHWEADQEDFLVLSGAALLIVEGQERPLGPWDLVHCPPGTEHVIVGAGEGPCVVVAVGVRDRSVGGPDWGGYTVDEAALRHGAGVTEATVRPEDAYAGLARRRPTRYRPEWLG
ncbi:MAG: cupin domain-containing protein [Thermoleophilia bacterium]|nr:cupin domain-containing protein [Thermoleophilia bacterium]